MAVEQKIEAIFDGLRKLAFYVGHGKYNDHMSLEEVNAIKNTIESILELEHDYEKSSSVSDKEALYERLKRFESFSVKEFIAFDINTL